MVKIPNFRWILAALLLLATMLNYIDRLTLSVLVGDIRKEFQLSAEDYAQIVSLFLLAYAIMYAGSGYLVDRLGTRRGFVLFMGCWSVAQMLHGFAVGKWSLGACRFLLGLAEPGNFPAAVKAVSEWFSAGERSIGIGIFNAGSSLGSAIAAPMAAFLALRYGWRFAFFATGALGLIWVAAWLMLYPPRVRAGPSSAKELVESRPPAGRWLDVLKMRQCYMLILARFLTDPVIYFIIFWLPEYLRSERGFTLAMVGRSAWVPFLFGDAGYLLGGWLSSRLVRRGWTLSRSRKMAMAAGAALLPSAIFAPLVGSASTAIAMTCFVVLGHAIWVANLLTLPADLFPSSQVGTVTGLSGMGGAVGGILANLLTGYAVSTVSFLPVFVVAGLMHPFAALLVGRLVPATDFKDFSVESDATVS